MSRPASQEAARTRTLLGIGGLVSLAAIVVGLAADAVNVVDSLRVGLLGKTEDTLIRGRYTPEDIAFARKAIFLDRYATLCFDGEENAGALEVSGHYRIDVFRCGTQLLAARVADGEGHAVMSEIDLPAHSATVVGLGDDLLNAARAQTRPALAQRLSPPAANIARALCQRPDPAGLVIRYQLTDGTCMDELVDQRTGAVIRRTNGVPCDCTGFR